MTRQAPRPRRERKGDRLVSPDARAVEIQIDHAIAPFDRVAREMETKWGADRLPELVSVETAEKYGRTIGRLNEAIRADNAPEVARLAQSAIRGLAVMDAEAEAAGAKQMPPEFWEYDLDGFRFAVMPDSAHWREVKAMRPDLQLFTMREAALALKAFASTGIIAATKDAFPGAEVVRATPVAEVPKGFWEQGGDQLPF